VIFPVGRHEADSVALMSCDIIRSLSLLRYKPFVISLLGSLKIRYFLFSKSQIANRKKLGIYNKNKTEDMHTAAPIGIQAGILKGPAAAPFFFVLVAVDDELLDVWLDELVPVLVLLTELPHSPVPFS